MESKKEQSRKSALRKEKEKKFTLGDDVVGRFIALSNIPIPIPDADKVDYYVTLFNTHYNSLVLWQLFLHDEEQWRHQGGFQKHITGVKGKIREYLNTFEEVVKASPKTTIYAPSTVLSIKKIGDVYALKNVNENFISFDVKEANYQTIATVIRLENPAFPATWKECVTQFSNSAFLQECKYFRQVVFGGTKLSSYITTLCPRLFIRPLIENISELKIFLNPICVSHDEVIYQVPKDFVLDETITSNLFSLPAHKGQRWHVSHFTLDLLTKQTKPPYFVKVTRFPIPSRQLKCIQHHHICQAVKKDLGKEVEENDLYFLHRTGEKAQFIKPTPL